MSDGQATHEHFIVPVRYYVVIFIVLLILTAITVAASRFDFGSFNLFIAVFIAVIKAACVGLIFMGLRWDKGFNIVIFIGSLLFLSLFFLLTFADTGFRGNMDSVEAGTHGIKQLVKKPSHGHHQPAAEAHH